MSDNGHKRCIRVLYIHRLIYTTYVYVDTFERIPSLPSINQSPVNHFVVLLRTFLLRTIVNFAKSSIGVLYSESIVSHVPLVRINLLNCTYFYIFVAEQMNEYNVLIAIAQSKKEKE